MSSIQQIQRFVVFSLLLNKMRMCVDVCVVVLPNGVIAALANKLLIPWASVCLRACTMTSCNIEQLGKDSIVIVGLACVDGYA